jgi:hypothetical protein
MPVPAVMPDTVAYSHGGNSRVGCFSSVGTLVTQGTYELAPGAMVNTVIADGNPGVPPLVDYRLNLSVEMPSVANCVSPPVAGSPGDCEQLGYGQWLALQPGRYQGVSVANQATLVLDDGRYFFDRLIVEPEGTLLIGGSGNTQVFVQGGMIFRGRQDGEVSARKLLFVVLGAYAHIERPFIGALVAPYASVELKPQNWGDTLDPSASTFHGSVVGRTITLHQDYRVIFVPYEAWSSVDGTWSPSPDSDLTGLPCSSDADCGPAGGLFVCSRSTPRQCVPIEDPTAALFSWRGKQCELEDDLCNPCVNDVVGSFFSIGRTEGETTARGRKNVHPEYKGHFNEDDSWKQCGGVDTDGAHHIQSIQRLTGDQYPYFLTTFNQNHSGGGVGFLHGWLVSDMSLYGDLDGDKQATFKFALLLGGWGQRHPGGFQLLGQSAFIGVEDNSPSEGFLKTVDLRDIQHWTWRNPQATECRYELREGSNVRVDTTLPADSAWGDWTGYTSLGRSVASAAAVRLVDDSVLVYVNDGSGTAEGLFLRAVPAPDGPSNAVLEGQPWLFQRHARFSAERQAWLPGCPGYEPDALCRHRNSEPHAWDVAAESANFLTECGTGDLYLIVLGGKSDLDAGQDQDVHRGQLFRVHGENDCAENQGTCELPWVERKGWWEVEKYSNCRPKRGAGTWVTPNHELVVYATEKFYYMNWWDIGEGMRSREGNICEYR